MASPAARATAAARKCLPLTRQAAPPAAGDVTAVRRALLASSRTVVLTGAGVSTDSGIPDYRSPGRPPHRPLQHHEFMGAAANRRRYWARSMIGYERMCAANPNAIHKMLAEAEASKRIHHLITQNVDGLHERHASKVLQLHGSIHRVVCMDCHTKVSRRNVQEQLLNLNADSEAFDLASSQEVRPDGDMLLGDTVYKRMKIPPCPSCGGVLKPDVVFFGDVVPKDVVETSFKLVDEASFLLVLGTTLSTRSALRLLERFVDRRGSEAAAILNRGDTRGDCLVAPNHRFDQDIRPILKELLK